MTQIRQGDVFLIPCNVTPTGKPVKAENGRVILAHGEVTGHHHSLDVAGAQLFGGDQPVLVISEDRLPTYSQDLMVRCAMFGDTPVTLGKAILAGAVGEVLIHQEHDAEIVPPGQYFVVRQREYTPEAIRNVAD